MSDGGRDILMEFEGVGKSYPRESGGSIEALADFDLALGENEFVVLLGPSGCGKTTALNLALGLEEPDCGAIMLAGGLERGRNMPCVFQHYTLFPWRSILQNVVFGAQMKGESRKERLDRGMRLLESVGLAQFAHACPHELSGGMRQRAAIAQALAVEPRLLLMDEPFGALDDSTRGELQRELIEIWRRQGFATLFVTHSIDEALVLGSRIIVMSDRPGRVAGEFVVDLPRPRDVASAPFVDKMVAIRKLLASQFLPG